jgi:hypothetical protein
MVDEEMRVEDAAKAEVGAGSRLVPADLTGE